MARDPEHDDEGLRTVPVLRRSPKGGEPLRLLVFGDSRLASVPLPVSGSIVIGRAADVHVVLEDPSISRRHARLDVGTVLKVEDLGSANGTRVRGQALVTGEAVEIRPGEVIELGALMAVVQPASQLPSRPRRIWSHDYFEARLEEECLRAERGGAPFVLVRIDVDSEPDRAAVQRSLDERLSPMDLVAEYAGRQLEVLLLDRDGPTAAALLEALVQALQEQDVTVRTGLAAHPTDGRSAEDLLARACARVRSVRPVSSEAPLLPSGAMQRLMPLVERVARGNISVLVLGETGVGKEVMAEAIHRLSPRRAKPLLKLNCAALSETLLESELFGYERGAFTGAQQTKPGLLETADGGTVFLDEVGELPPSMQVKLLRVLEERQTLRVGGLKPRSIDVRFVAATNRDLEAEIDRGTFRRDLYFRLAGVSLVIPPLRDRVDEIADLSRSFLAQSASELAMEAPPLAPEALELLRRYHWPGNIRELRNVMERALLLAGDGAIEPEHLPLEKMSAPLARGDGELRGEIEDVERRRIEEALARCNGNQTRAAKLLGISRGTLLSRLERYGFPRPRK